MFSIQDYNTFIIVHNLSCMAKKKRKAHNRGHVHVDAHYRKKPGA